MMLRMEGRLRQDWKSKYPTLSQNCQGQVGPVPGALIQSISFRSFLRHDISVRNAATPGIGSRGRLP